MGLSGSQWSIWNKKRCIVYSRIVHTMFPRKKHDIVFTTDSAGMEEI